MNTKKPKSEEARGRKNDKETRRTFQYQLQVMTIRMRTEETYQTIEESQEVIEIINTDMATIEKLMQVCPCTRLERA